MLINKMLELVQMINNCKTGVDIIDNIVNQRKQTFYKALGVYGLTYLNTEDYRTSAYKHIQNYISVVSGYGGLFKYVCEQYQSEIENTDSIKEQVVKRYKGL